jgi:hypothetical protein
LPPGVLVRAGVVVDMGGLLERPAGPAGPAPDQYPLTPTSRNRHLRRKPA